jgi:diguanylate cyclase (GGDEF)-like protein
MDKYLKKQSNPVIILISLLLLTIIAIIDDFTGYQLSFSFFYIIPILIITWYASTRFGLFFCIVCATTWFFINEFYQKKLYSAYWISYWNASIRLSFFVTIAYLLGKIKKSLEFQTNLARQDYLTDSFNRRGFYELIEREINRANRELIPLTFVYLDLDNFKKLNDLYGHETGDIVLKQTVDTVKLNLRKIDIIGRLGGDEFMILLVGVDADTAKDIVSRVNQELSNKMRANLWEITFSFGVLTYLNPPKNIDEAISKSDDLMYTVKNRGKNSILYAICTN